MKWMTVGLMLSLTASAGMLLTPQTAEACQPPPAVMFMDHGSEDAPLVFSDKTIAVRISVQDETNQTHTVTVSPVDDPETQIEGEWLIGELSERDASDYLIWAPTGELPDGDYRLELVTEYGWENSTVFRHVSELESPGLETGEYELTAHETLSNERNCCDIADCEPVVYDCSGAPTEECRSCWSLSYDYHPRLIVPLEHQRGSYIVHIYKGNAEDEGRYVRSAPLYTEQRQSIVTFAEDELGPYCLQLEVERMSDGEIVREFSVCTEESSISYEKRELDNTEAMAACDTEPENPDDPNWREFEEEYDTDSMPPAGTEDIEDVEPRKRRRPMALCSVTRSAAADTSGYLLVFGALGAMLARRRRRD